MFTEELRDFPHEAVMDELVYLSLLVVDPEYRNNIPVKIYQCMSCGRYYLSDDDEPHDDQLDPPYCFIKNPMLVYELNHDLTKPPKTKQLRLEV